MSRSLKGADLNEDHQTEEKAVDADQLPAGWKPGVLEWMESFLPFRLPRIRFPQAAKNLDKAVSRIIDAGASNAVTRIAVSTDTVSSLGKARQSFIERGTKQIRARQHLELDDRSLSYVLGEARIGQQNREKVLEAAAEDIVSDPPNADSDTIISDDWLNHFAKLASEKGDEDIQVLWGKILAGEIRQPGSTKIRTLQHLSSFDKTDAIFAHSFLRNAIDGSWVFTDFYAESGRYNEILTAQEMGLINSDTIMTLNLYPGTTFKIRCDQRVILLELDVNRKVQFSNNNLTTLGRDLLKLVKNEPADEEMLSTFCQKIYADGTSIRIGDIGPPIDSLHSAIVNIRPLYPK
jgi:Protein of unknown function (DUF2806)